MRKHLLASAALIVGAGFAFPAAADITVDGTVTYDKKVTITETLTKRKRVFLDVIITRTGRTAAEANAIENQRIGDGPNPLDPNDQLEGSNTAVYDGQGLLCPGCVGQRGRPLADFSAEVIGSINDNTGVTQYNQDVGWGSNQGNVLSAALGRNADFVEANNSAAQYNQGNTIHETGRIVDPQATPPRVALIRQALMVGSVNHNTGLTQVNQNAGIFNNQLNSVALALGFNSGLAVALAESDLGQWNTGQKTTEWKTSRVAGMSDSVSHNVGIVMGNQAAGHMANQANKMALSASVVWNGGAAGTAAFVNSLPPGVF
jgi:hypothetical protein